MAATGVGVLYVTHHLGEVFRVANKVSVFRDGKVVGAGPVGDFDHAAIVAAARRRGVARRGDGVPAAEGRAVRRRRDHEVVFEVEDLRAGALAGVSFKVERGEIVGIAGLAGSGRDTVLGASFGALPRDRGRGEAGRRAAAGRRGPTSPSAAAWRTSRRTARSAAP